jgi:hypothetical protein
MFDLLTIYLAFALSLAPLFFLFAWGESENYTRNQRRALAALTLCAPVTSWFVPLAAAAYCLFLLMRGVSKCIGIVAGEE